MKRRARFRPAARLDIQRLTAFLVHAPPAVAVDLVQRLEKHVERLTRHPLIGRPLERSELRETLVPFGKSRYVIRYKITQESVIIVRIWHGKEDRPR